MPDKGRQLDRLARGLCSNCGKRPHKPGCKWCHHCLGEHYLTETDRRAERSERGICPRCKRGRRDKSKVECERCRYLKRMRYKLNGRNDRRSGDPNPPPAV